MAGVGNVARRVTNPTGKGGFKKGQSGNGGARTGAASRIFNNLAIEARKYGKMALGNLVYLARKAENESVRLNATIAILDRGYGRPTQSIDFKTDAPMVQLNLFEGFGLDDQRLAAETLAAIEHNPAALQLAVDLMNDPTPLSMDDVIDVTPQQPAEQPAKVAPGTGV
jgi:hypothetical protein